MVKGPSWLQCGATPEKIHALLH